MAHLVDATGYSLEGLRVLNCEAAFRQEAVLAFFLFVTFFVFDATAIQFAILGILFFILFAVEALNTAIESIVDEISPQRSEFARNTKDLGSFAVMCVLIAIGTYMFVTLFTILELLG